MKNTLGFKKVTPATVGIHCKEAKVQARRPVRKFLKCIDKRRQWLELVEHVEMVKRGQISGICCEGTADLLMN